MSKMFISAAGLLALAIALCPALSAQWPKFQTPGIPRTASGEPQLDAPAPRTSDGKPDLSGLWRGGLNAGGRRGAAPEPLPPGAPPLANFGNIAANIKEGLPLQPWAAEVLKKRQADSSKDNPEANCLPMGIMQNHTQGYPRRFLQSPSLVVILYESWHNFRQLYLDGRPLPAPDPIRQEAWYGYSVGKWEGDTLMVESIGFRDDGWLDIVGNPMTSAAKVTERFRRPTFGRMEIDITVDDPKAYTRPWTVRMIQRIMVDEEMMEMICNENRIFLASEQTNRLNK